MSTPAPTGFDTPFGRFELQRFPAERALHLQAWDAADAYVLDDIAASRPGAGSRCLVVGDRFGAVSITLAKGLEQPQVTMMSDSVLGHRGMQANLAAAGLPGDLVATAPSTHHPDGPLDLIVVKVPRSLALLEDQLRRVRPALHPGSVVVGAGMTRHIHTSTLQVIERILGPTTTSMARRKARLIHVELDPDLDPGPDPFPAAHDVDGVVVVAHAGVFAAGKLDQGTRVLLDHLPDVAAGTSVVDVGCGDGVVGLTIAARQPDAHLTFTDESYMAVASARAGWDRTNPDHPARFLVGDCLEGVADTSADLVVINPPFHDDNAVGDAIAWAMFTDARRALRPGGRLVVVGNRHLAHHAKLARLFGSSEVVAATAKFVVHMATRLPPKDAVASEVT